MEITRQKVEAYLDDLVVQIYLSQGDIKDLRKLHNVIETLESGGYNLSRYREIEVELSREYQTPII